MKATAHEINEAVALGKETEAGINEVGRCRSFCRIYDPTSEHC